MLGALLYLPVSQLQLPAEEVEAGVEVVGHHCDGQQEDQGEHGEPGRGNTGGG